MYNECPFSTIEFSGISLNSQESDAPVQRLERIVVECPECGAIRTLKVPRYGDYLVYISHSRLDGSTRLKPRYKRDRSSGEWTWKGANGE